MIADFVANSPTIWLFVDDVLPPFKIDRFGLLVGRRPSKFETLAFEFLGNP
jgi:hypothetical protein